MGRGDRSLGRGDGPLGRGDRSLGTGDRPLGRVDRSFFIDFFEVSVKLTDLLGQWTVPLAGLFSIWTQYMQAHNILVDGSGCTTLCDFGASFPYGTEQQAFFESMVCEFSIPVINCLTVPYYMVHLLPFPPCCWVPPLLQEVRAFGLFLQGLIGQVDLSMPRMRVSPEDDQDEKICASSFESLRGIARWCLCAIQAARPKFSEVVASLAPLYG